MLYNFYTKKKDNILTSEKYNNNKGFRIFKKKK